MKITEIKIQNFKSFGPEETRIRMSKDLNIFVGKNNAGKSNILNALNMVFTGANTIGGRSVRANSNTGINENLWFKHKMVDSGQPVPIVLEIEASFTQSDFDSLLGIQVDTAEVKAHLESHKDAPVRIKYTILPDKESMNFKLEYIEHGGITIYELKNMTEAETYDFPTRRKLSGSGPHNYLSKLNSLLDSQFKVISPIRKANTGIASDFKNLEHHPKDFEIVKKTNERMKELFPEINEVKTFDGPNGEEINLEFSFRLPLSFHGDGIGQICVLIYEIYRSNAKIIGIEEPEVHLHPYLVRKLIRLLQKISEQDQVQFFIVTHSAILITPQNITRIYRCEYDSEKGTKVYDLSADSSLEPNLLAKKLNPDSSELFFADKVILVEGLTDQFFLDGIMKRKIVSAEEIKIIAVGGTGFLMYQRILEAFKIPYAVVCDNNCLTGEQPNRIKETLEKNPDIKGLEQQRELLKSEKIWVLSQNDMPDYYPARFSQIGKNPVGALEVLSDLKDEDFEEAKLKELVSIIKEALL